MKYFKSHLLFIFLFILISLGSCSIYKDPITLTYVNTGIHASGNLTLNPETSVVREKEIQASIAASAVEVTPVKQSSAHLNSPTVKTEVIEACDRLIPPIIGQIPRLTQEQIQTISTSSSLVASQQLLDELEKIYKYASAKTIELSTAFAKQAKSCRKVTIVVP